MISELISNIFVCKCAEFKGAKDLRQIDNGRVVGKCLKCNKRVYATLIFQNEIGAFHTGDKQ